MEVMTSYMAAFAQEQIKSIVSDKLTCPMCQCNHIRTMSTKEPRVYHCEFCHYEFGREQSERAKMIYKVEKFDENGNQYFQEDLI